MIGLAFLGIAIGYLLMYSGITNRDPKNELVANLHGGHSDRVTDASASPPPDAGSMYAGSGDVGPTKQRGKLKMLPARYCTHPGILIDAGIYDGVIYVCTTFGLKVSAGYSLLGHVANSDHKCGGAADFVGKTGDMKAAHSWALGQSFAYVEPWADSTTVGRLGTTGPHIHISFFRCPTHSRKT